MIEGTSLAPPHLIVFDQEMMMSGYRKGTKVRWKWANGTGEGKIVETFTDDVAKTISGSRIKRKASKDEPAYLIEQDDGGKVLKSKSELEHAD
ncbi:hypothetical protein SY94_3712 [Agrobacterium tumefaciens]|nr:hypothetical protein SY94_3712 [Agrobacterium tumefaciens]